MISFNKIGWNNFFQNYHNNFPDKNLKFGRVGSIAGFKYLLLIPEGEIEAELSGKLLYAALNEDLPKVGDWVFYMDYGTIGYIIDIFPRMNEVYRKIAGKRNERQVLAANIDYALIVQGLDRDFNLMRLDRYLVQMANCNVQPVVLLNKADLIDNPDQFKAEIEKLHRNCPVYFCSTYNGSGLEILKHEILEEGKTYIMIGSSGVGKSSILKSLLPEVQREVKDISDSTSKGKHTTTTRDLFLLPNGSLLIDTPGMREFGLAIDENQSGESLFPVIEDFAIACKFADCSHLNEAGCGVLKGLEEGKISAEAFESYIKLIKEQRRFEMKAGDQKKLGKQFGKMTREAKEYRKKYKY